VFCGILVQNEQLNLTRIITGAMFAFGGGSGLYGYWRLITPGPEVRLLTILYFCKEFAIFLVGVRMFFLAITSFAVELPMSPGIVVSYVFVGMAALFIFTAGLYTFLGTYFDIFSTKVYKNPFSK
jgi:hypothetical protein